MPIITDAWRGLDEFFQPDREILVVETTTDVLECLRHLDETESAEIGARGRLRVLAHHTADHRAQELENHVLEILRDAPPSDYRGGAQDWAADRSGVLAV